MACDRLSAITQWLQHEDEELLYTPDVQPPAIVLPAHFELNEEVRYQGEVWRVVEWHYTPQQGGYITYTLQRLGMSEDGYQHLVGIDGVGIQPLEP
jgi:hypothetical protein